MIVLLCFCFQKDEGQNLAAEEILVTGATGLIGNAVVRDLVQQGLSVRALIRSREHMFLCENSVGQLSFVEADFLSLTESAARKLCEGVSSIVHCAGLVHKPNSDSDLYQRLNERPTELLALAARGENVQQFVFLSSSSVYGNRETHMATEDEPCISDTPYATSKINCEQLLRTNPPAESTVIVRPSMVFGEGDRGNMLPLIKQVLSGKYFLISGGNAQKSLIYANDFARAMRLILGRKGSGIYTYNIANPNPVSMRELSMSILAASERATSIPSIPAGLLQPLASLANAVLGARSPLSKERLDKLTRSNTISVARFCRDYGFAPQHELKDALTNEIAWARAAKLL